MGYAAKSVTLTVLTRDGRIGIDEKFKITVSISEGIEGEPPQQPTFKGAKMLYPNPVGPIQVVRSQNINGVRSSFVGTEWTYNLKATAKGKFTFGPITVGGVKSNIVTYTVTDSSSDPYSSSGGYFNGNMPDDDKSQKGPKFIGKGSEQLFMVARVSKQKSYEQEALLYTVTLYTTYDGIRFLGATESPKFDGFTLEESNEKIKSWHIENYKGKSYKATVIAKYVIFPQMKGALKITGNKYTITVESRYNYYDPFFGYMSVGNPKQLSVQPNDLTVNVMPLPQPQPAGFSGGVGQFKLSCEPPRNPLLSNQATSVIYKISGQGNIKYVTMPDLNNLYPPQLEIYSPETEVNATVTESTVKGNVTFDYSMMPLETGSFAAPAVKLIYFDPNTGKYEESTVKGFHVEVNAGKKSNKSQKKNKITFIPQLMKTNVGKTLRDPIVTSLWYYLIYISLIAVLIIFLFAYKRHMQRMADVVALRSRKAGKYATKRLNESFKAMNRNDREVFYDELLSALWGFAEDRLKISGSQLNRDNILQSLLKGGIENNAADAFIKLLDDCEYEKYAPGADLVVMQEYYRRACDMINLLRKRVK